jgi:hypothetical protein
LSLSNGVYVGASAEVDEVPGGGVAIIVERRVSFAVMLPSAPDQRRAISRRDKNGAGAGAHH